MEYTKNASKRTYPSTARIFNLSNESERVRERLLVILKALIASISINSLKYILIGRFKSNLNTLLLFSSFGRWSKLKVITRNAITAKKQKRSQSGGKKIQSILSWSLALICSANAKLTLLIECICTYTDRQTQTLNKLEHFSIGKVLYHYLFIHLLHRIIIFTYKKHILQNIIFILCPIV